MPCHVQVSISKADAAGKSDEKNASENGGAKDVMIAPKNVVPVSPATLKPRSEQSQALESCVRTFYSRLNDWLSVMLKKIWTNFQK